MQVSSLIFARLTWLPRLICLIAVAVATSSSGAAPAKVGPRELQGASDASDSEHETLEPLIAKTAKSESEADHLEALQLYAAGRLKEQKQNLPAALRFYERAFRRDPEAVGVLKQIIPLAFNLGRSEEAFRYALKLGQADPSDPVLLRQLGVQLTGEGRLEEALTFYERAWQAERERGTRGPSTVLLLSQLGKLYLVENQIAKAADTYAQIVAALDKPEEFHLDSKTRKLVLDDAAKTLDLFDIQVGGGNEVAAFELFGRTFLEAGRVDLAQSAFNRADKLRMDPPLAAWHQAQLASARNEPDAAIAAIDEYFKAHRANHGDAPYVLLEKLLTQTGKRDQLLDRLQQIHNDDPKNEPLKYYLAESYRKAGELAKAAPLYAYLAEHKPSLDLYRAQIDLYRRQRDVPELLKTLAKVLAEIRLVDLLGDEGKALLADNPLVDELLAAARKQLAEKPDELAPDRRAGLGALALSAKRLDVTREFFDSAIAAQPAKAGELLRIWGLGLLMQDQPAEAALVFGRAPTEETPAAKAQRLYHLAGALEMSGKTDEALATAREATDLAEANSEKLDEIYYTVLGRAPWVLFHAQRYEAARDAYTALLARFEPKLDDKGARSIAREARLMLSNVAALTNDMPEAEERLEQILDEAPDDVSASNDLGYIWADQGKHLERSLRMIQYAVAKSPDNGAYRDSLGWAWYRMGKFDEAAAELTKAIELLEEPDGVILDHLGDAFSKAGRADEARAAWEKAVAGFEKEKEPDKAQATREKLTAQPAAKP